MIKSNENKEIGLSSGKYTARKPDLIEGIVLLVSFHYNPNLNLLLAKVLSIPLLVL